MSSRETWRRRSVMIGARLSTSHEPFGYELDHLRLMTKLSERVIGVLHETDLYSSVLPQCRELGLDRHPKAFQNGGRLGVDEPHRYAALQQPLQLRDQFRGARNLRCPTHPSEHEPSHDAPHLAVVDPSGEHLPPSAGAADFLDEIAPGDPSIS